MKVTTYLSLFLLLINPLSAEPSASSAPPLHQAVRDYVMYDRQAEDNIRKLLAQGCDVNSRDTNGNTPLMWAASWYYPDSEYRYPEQLIEQLIRAGADIHARNNDGLNAAELACCTPYPSKDLINYLKSKGLCIGRDAELVRAAADGNIREVTHLLNSGADPNFCKGEALINSLGVATEGAKPNEKSIIRLLLHAGANPNHQVVGLMNRTIHTGSYDVLELLLQHGMDVTRTGDKATNILANIYRHNPGNKKLFNILVSRGMSVNGDGIYNGDTLLHLALEEPWHNRREQILHLLELGVDPTRKNRDGKTPLDVAREKKLPHGTIQALEMAEHYLMKKKLTINKANAEGRTPLMLAVADDKAEAVEVHKLLRQGADVHARDAQGRTALFYFTSTDTQKAEKARLLIAAGADVNARDKEGNTPLLALPPMAMYFEPEQSCCRIIEQLWQAGADLEVRDKEGFNMREKLILGNDGKADPKSNATLHRLGLTVRPEIELIQTAQTRNVKRMAELLQNGADPNYMNAAAILSTLGDPMENSSDVQGTLPLLLQAGANPNLCADKILHRLSLTREHTALELLFNHGMKLPDTPQLIADCLDHLWGQETGVPKPCFELLIRKGADINSLSNRGVSLLSFVSIFGQSKEEMLYLMKLKANPTLRGNDGKTALEHAQEHHRADLISLLEDYLKHYSPKN